MLDLMEGFPLAEWGENSARSLHVMIEAKKLAYADVRRYVADPRAANVPAAELLSKDYARERRRLIDLGRARCQVEAGAPSMAGGDTIYLSVVDGEGNMVSLIQSNYRDFGSGLVAEGTGFALQDRAALFSLDPSHANALAPRKRPLHTIIPAFLSKGDVRIAFGIMGGWNQAQAHAQFVANVVDHGLNIQAALEAPRFTKLDFDGCGVMVEGRVPAAVRSQLEALGHVLDVRGDYSGQMGGGQAVLRDFAAGVNYGASDPRKDGAAIPEPLPPR
jgi:gamma-glutamyltranspeptidase/glutathione hydrolase